MNYNEMLSIMEQFENMGFLCDTGKRRNGKIVFVFRWEPSPETMDELYHYMQSEPAAYEFLAAVAYRSGMNPGKIRATISRLKKLSAT
jgi:hypothetical protein